MNTNDLFLSLTNELNALKNRVRNFIGKAHWLSDGQWKESVLKSVIRRHIPSNIGVGSGFIVSETNCSKQIDVILYDNKHPILFKDGDFVIITPDSVKGIIEVKTNIENITKFKDYTNTLNENIKFVRENGNLEYLFTGLFSFDTEMKETNFDTILNNLLELTSGDGYISNINHISLGENIFIKFWEEDPVKHTPVYNTWHLYNLDRKSFAYFIMNAVIEVSDNKYELKDYLYFPPEGKEGSVLKKKKLPTE